MRIVVYGLALTMMTQPSGGLGSCQIACGRPQLKSATPNLGVQVVAAVTLPVASISSIGQRTRKASVGRLAAIETVTPRIEVLRFEHPAFSNQNVIGGDRNELLHRASAPTLVNGLNADATRVKATIGLDRHSVGVAKSPQQLAQDAWDARQRLAYVDSIILPRFVYAEVQEMETGELRVTPALVGSNSQEASRESQPNADQSQEIQNNKSQALSVPMVGQPMELLSK